jgi:hypothetical protein
MFKRVTDGLPGDVMVERKGGRKHMGFYKETKDGIPYGLQMGVSGGPKLAPWGRNGYFAGKDGAETEYYRLERPTPQSR